jgi:hypothetical protein
MTREAPAWLAEFQARFGSMIRTPLDRTSGTLAAQPSLYEAHLVSGVLDASTVTGAGRLAVYNRQLWFRLFDVLQNAFPLTSRLVGYWQFNDYASRFFLAHPPRGWDIDRVSEGFEAFFEEQLECENADERQALIESARIDDAWREVFRAPKIKPFRPSAADAARLLDARLTPSPAVRVIEEHFPLLELRKKVLHDSGEARVLIPPALLRARAWAIIRKDEGMLQLPLEPREAELLMLLRDGSVRDALARLEQACTEEERALLPAKTQTWLARSVERDFWIGISG